MGTGWWPFTGVLFLSDYPRRGVSVQETLTLLISRKQHSMLPCKIKYP